MMKKQLFTVISLLVLLTGCSEKYRKINKEHVTTATVPMDSISEAKTKGKSKIQEDLLLKGYQVLDVVNSQTKDTVLMQQYYVAILKMGPTRRVEDSIGKELEQKHLAHLKKMYDMGYADISGPFGDVGELINLTIYNVPSQEMADSLAHSDPMVKEGLMTVEVHPWWAPKGYRLK